jgi:hypothetical protein
LARSQGVTPGDICAYLEVSATSEIDFYFYGAKLSQLRTLCGLPKTAFHVHAKVVGSLVRAAVAGRQLLAREDNHDAFAVLRKGRPISRFWCFDPRIKKQRAEYITLSQNPNLREKNHEQSIRQYWT